MRERNTKRSWAPTGVILAASHSHVFLCFISPSSRIRTVTTVKKYLPAVGSGAVLLEWLTLLVQLKVLLET